MRIVLLGAGGQVGQSLASKIAPENLVAFSRADLDLMSYDGDTAPLLAAFDSAPDVIINAAAYTHVDKCESNEAEARQINGTAVAHLQQAADSLGSLLVHYSTDYVFDGMATAPYKETDAPSPINVYGDSKRQGEAACLASDNSLVIRTSWVYSPHGRNFVKSILHLARSEPHLNIVSDQHGTPTSADFLAEVTLQLIGNNARGLFHVTPRGYTTWHGFACLIVREAESYGLPITAKTITAIASSDYPTPARRPLYSVLDNSKLRNEQKINLPDWQVGVKNVVSKLCEEA